MSEARRRMDTRDTKRSGAAHANASASGASSANGRTAPATGSFTPSPGAYKITPPRPFRAHDSAKWSPTSTKPQRASLLRADAPKATPSTPAPVSTTASTKELPRFAQTIKHTPSIDANASDAEIARELDAVYAAQLASSSGSSSHTGKSTEAEASEANGTFANEEDETARARRYTPKQRPTQRRGRSHERSNGVRVKTPDHDPESGEFGRTVPDLRIPAASSRPPTLPLGAGVLNVTRPGGAHGVQGAAHGAHSAHSAHPIHGAHGGHTGQVVTPDTPTQPRGRPVPRLPLSAPPPSFSAPSAFAQPPMAAARSELQFQPPRQPFAPAQTRRDADKSLLTHEASIVVDPALNGLYTELDPNQFNDAHSGYQPLPSDPAAFDQFMREQAAARGARLNWKQQATLVIPREELEVPEERRLFHPKLVVGIIAVAAASALFVFAISQFGDRATAVRPVPLDTSTSAAHTAGGMTVIATEPSGAELLLDGAVVGNTPLEVVRPQSGHPELTYVVRLRGFTQELVRLSPDSQPAIRVTLTPETGVP